MHERRAGEKVMGSIGGSRPEEQRLPMPLTLYPGHPAVGDAPLSMEH